MDGSEGGGSASSGVLALTGWAQAQGFDRSHAVVSVQWEGAIEGKGTRRARILRRKEGTSARPLSSGPEYERKAEVTALIQQTKTQEPKGPLRSAAGLARLIYPVLPTSPVLSTSPRSPRRGKARPRIQGTARSRMSSVRQWPQVACL